MVSCAGIKKKEIGILLASSDAVSDYLDCYYIAVPPYAFINFLWLEVSYGGGDRIDFGCIGLGWYR